MVIPFRFRYTYKNYPFSPKATMKSKQFGMLTCTAICLVYGLFWAMIVDGLLLAMGIPNEAATFLALLSLVGFVFLIRHIKRSGVARIEQMAMADLMALQNTDPAAFTQYAAVFKEELSRYQNPYQYQAPPHHQTSPAAPPVQQTPKEGFDIQVEQPEPISEAPVVGEVPAQQHNVIELPEIQPEVFEPSPVQTAHPEEPSASVDATVVPEKKFCGRCGTKLKSGSLFCHNCGSKL